MQPGSTIIWAAAIVVLKDGQWHLALSIMNSMPDMRLLPSEISYGALICACDKGGQWQPALGLLSAMTDLRVIPDVMSYSAAIGACERGAGCWPW
ncbi:unnamed protein product, partial [Polarella glacialis]